MPLSMGLLLEIAAESYLTKGAMPRTPNYFTASTVHEDDKLQPCRLVTSKLPDNFAVAMASSDQGGLPK